MRPPLLLRAFPDMEPVALMRLTEVEDADEVLKDHDQKDIVVEQKYDGWKTQVIKDGGKIHLYSRRGEDVTGNFPTIAKAVEGLPDGTLVEGELVYWDKGKQDVGKVTSLAGSSAETAVEKAKGLPGTMKLHLYDILWHKGRKVADEPFSKRRALLESTVKTSDTVLLTEQYPFSKWQETMNKAVEKGGEGIVLKLKSAKYQYKPKGENEPKPADTMWKYKGGVGKHGSDDYVVYGTTKSKTGKLMAQFGQYHKGTLYAISEIGNFSAENEAEVNKRLKKGPFVIEIGFQERVPGGLRHQKFLKFRDDKKPKDATMHEFHAKRIAEFEPVGTERKAMFALASAPDPVELATTLEKAVGKTPAMAPARVWSRIGQVGGIDGDKMFRIMSALESGGRSDIVGDSGTSFGPTQVHGPYLLARLAGMPDAQAVTGLSAEEMRKLSSEWLVARKKLSGHMWKDVPINQEEAKGLLPSAIVRREKTFIRKPNMVVEKRGDHFVGRVLDEDALRDAGIDTNTEVFRRAVRDMYTTYITDNVALSALAQALVAQATPLAFQKYKRKFNAANIRKDKMLANLLMRTSAADFSSKIAAVARLVDKSGYDTTAPGAYTMPQLVIIANGSGIGVVQRFLLNKKPFARGHLNSFSRMGRYPKVLGALKKKDPDLGPIIAQILTPQVGNGLAGFKGETAARIGALLAVDGEEVGRADMVRMLVFANEDRPRRSRHTIEDDPVEQARKIMALVDRWLNYETLHSTELRDAGVNLIRINRSIDPPRLFLWIASENTARLARLLPKKIWGMPVVLHADQPRMTFELPVVREFEDVFTPIDVEARMPITLFSHYKSLLKKVRDELTRMRKHVPEDQLRRTVFLHVAEQLGYTEEQLKKLIGEYAWLRFSCRMPPFSKVAEARGVLAFPGQFAEDIKSGRLERTIRPADMPVEPEEVVRAITYSGGDICRIKILSKETMSLPRLEKAFGKHVARSLEHRFGPDRRFVVIRFTRFGGQDVDDGELDEKKRGETLIDKEGTKLTRGQIYDHYAKPAIRKQIMSRIKGKPALIYLGVGKNEKILKRNHDGKPIVLSSDDEKGSESPDNYWYWAKRRLLAVHEVFGTKTDMGFVDLDLHGGYPPEKAKEYARKVSAAIKEKYGVPAKVYQSGGTGLHVEFKLGEKVGIDGLRKELRALLDKLNESFDGATTSIVKGKGMRTDVSTLHNKGSLRAPGSLGETWGKVKKPLSQETDDDYGNNNFGGKDSGTGPLGEGGAITPMPYRSMAPEQVGVWTASGRRELFRIAGHDEE